MPRRLAFAATLLSALVLCATALALLKFMPKGLDTGARKVSGKSKTIVVDNRGVTVYELGGESLAKLECVTRACFNIWPPLKVASATTKVSVGKGVPGKVSVLHRVKGGFYQLMLDRHPLYFYSGDNGSKGPTSGQGIASFGGTWHVVPASGS
jgi:predicted lipoprotein with Yx(FWY)xxD motif